MAAPQWLIDFNTQVDLEMNEESIAFRSERIRDRHEGVPLTRKMPSTAALAVSVNFLKGTSSNIVQPISTSQAVLSASLHAAAVTFLMNLPDILLADNPGQALSILAKQIAMAMSAVGSARYICDKVEAAILKYSPEILAVGCAGEKTVLDAWLISSSGNATTALTATAMYGVKALFHAICAAVAYMRGDSESAKISWKETCDVFQLNNLCRIIACALSEQVISSTTVVFIDTPLIHCAVAVGIYVVAMSVTESLIKRKDHAGGWGSWIASCFVKDRRRKIWAGQHFDEYRDHITPQLCCDICGRIVVDAVRSTFSGRLYDRLCIYEEMDKPGAVDPRSQEPATHWDYLPAPRAHARAHEVSQCLGAVLIPLQPSRSLQEDGALRT